MSDFRQRRFLIFPAYLGFAFLLISGFFVQNNFAQFCIGSLHYTLRDENGEKMSDEQAEKVVIKVMNTWEPESDSEGRVYVKGYANSERRKFRTGNQLNFIRNCGNLDSLVLQYKGKTMSLIFANRDHWRRYKIDSLPFQEGTFRLKRKFEGARNFETTPCEKAEKIDPTNQWSGKECIVTGQSWIKLDKEDLRDK